MIVINGKKFAESDNEFIDSLFDSGGTCVGYAKVYTRFIALQNMQKQRVGIVNHEGVVATATKRSGGWWYSYGTPDIIGECLYSRLVTDGKLAAERLNH